MLRRRSVGFAGSYSASIAASAMSRIALSPAGSARNEAAVRATCGNVVPRPSRSPSPGWSSGPAACAATHARSPSSHGMLRAAATARASPKGAAHLGKTCSNAVDVTNVSSAGSNQITCEGCFPAGRIAARSLSETLTTKASGCAARRRSATVSARSRAAEEPGASFRCRSESPRASYRRAGS